MKKLLQLEEIAMTALGIAGLYYQPMHISGWLWPLVFLSPDFAMLGYAINARAGAVCYNFIHHKGVAILITALGFYCHIDWLLLAGIVLFAHSAFDRMLGFGLKYPGSFKRTHLDTEFV